MYEYISQTVEIDWVVLTAINVTDVCTINEKGKWLQYIKQNQTREIMIDTERDLCVYIYIYIYKKNLLINWIRSKFV